MNKRQAKRFFEVLRERGFRIQIRHIRERCGDVSWSEFFKPMPNGGRTEVTIFPPAPGTYWPPLGSQVWKGTAVCSDKDNFNRKRGMWIASGRALKKMMLDLYDQEKNWRRSRELFLQHHEHFWDKAERLRTESVNVASENGTGSASPSDDDDTHNSLRLSGKPKPKQPAAPQAIDGRPADPEGRRHAGFFGFAVSESRTLQDNHAWRNRPKPKPDPFVVCYGNQKFGPFDNADEANTFRDILNKGRTPKSPTAFTLTQNQAKRVLALMDSNSWSLKK